MTLKATEGKRAVLERIAADLKRLEKEAAEIGEGFLAFLLVNAASEASAASKKGRRVLAGGPTFTKR